VAVLHHPLGHLLAEIKRAIQIDLDDHIPILLRHVRQRREFAGTGIGEQKVDMSEVLGHRRNATFYVFWLTLIDHERLGILARLLPAEFGCLFGQIEFTIRDCDLRAAPG